MSMPADRLGLITFEKAYDRFKHVVSEAHARSFNNMELADVKLCIQEVQKRLEDRQQLLGFRRLEPLLKGLDKYSEVANVLCNGTPYLSWIWAPIKLLILIAENHIKELEKIVSAYESIGNAMPRFERLTQAFKDSPEFQRVMGAFYQHVLEFHRRTYQYFNHRGWKTVFVHFWKNFDLRFKYILDALEQQRDLIDKEANAIDVIEAKKFREAQMIKFNKWQEEKASEIEREERNWENLNRRDAIAWLGDCGIQEDIKQKHLRVCKDECDAWVLELPSFKQQWLHDNDKCSVLWLHGKIGAGKSVQCAQIVAYLQQKSNIKPVYYFFNPFANQNNVARDLLQNIAHQLMKFNITLCSLVLEEYANQGQQPNMVNLMDMIKKSLSTMSGVRIIIDGADEVDIQRQLVLETIEDLLRLPSSYTSADIKILISSRNVADMSKMCRRLPTICLGDFSEGSNRIISAYIEDSISRTEHLRLNSREFLSQMKNQLSSKAKGMFLWVRLVIEFLDTPLNESDLYDIVEHLPEELEAVYERIMVRICGDIRNSTQKKALEILKWLAVSLRPLKVMELGSAIAFDPAAITSLKLNSLDEKMLSICDPLLEKNCAQENGVQFIHFTVTKYLRGIYPSSKLTFKSDFSPLELNFMALYACSFCLWSAFDLIDPDIPKAKKQDQVLRGYHDFHIYANDHFDVHLVKFVEALKAGEAPAEQLGTIRNILPRIVSRHAVIRSKRNFEEFGGQILVDNDFFQMLNVLKLERQEQIFFAELLWSRSGCQDAQKTYSQVPDQTLFSELKTAFTSICEALFTRVQDAQDIDTTLISQFLNRHGEAPFRCRERSCIHSLNGFTTKADRDRHEKAHYPTYKCREPNCHEFLRTFTDKTTFSKHVRNYHTGLRALSKVDVPSLHAMLQKHKSTISEVETDSQYDQMGSQNDYPLELQYSSDGGRHTYRIFHELSNGSLKEESFKIESSENLPHHYYIDHFRPTSLPQIFYNSLEAEDLKISDDGEYLAISKNSSISSDLTHIYSIKHVNRNLSISEFKTVKGRNFYFTSRPGIWFIHRDGKHILENFAGESEIRVFPKSFREQTDFSVYMCRFSRGNRHLALIDSTRKMSVWELAKMEKVWSSQRDCNSCSFSADGKILAVAYLEGGVVIYDTEDFGRYCGLEIGMSELRSLEVSFLFNYELLAQSWEGFEKWDLNAWARKDTTLLPIRAKWARLNYGRNILEVGMNKNWVFSFKGAKITAFSLQDKISYLSITPLKSIGTLNTCRFSVHPQLNILILYHKAGEGEDYPFSFWRIDLPTNDLGGNKVVNSLWGKRKLFK